MIKTIDIAHQMNLCIVESDRNRAIRLQSIFTEGHFHNLHSVGNFQGLQEYIRNCGLDNKVIDLVVVSENLGDIGVIEACNILSQKEHGNIAVVVILANNDDGQMKQCYEAGALDVLISPVTAADLLPRIRLTLNLQQERELRLLREEAWETELAERKIMEARLKHLVAHDDLTGLANRRRLEQALELAVIRARNFHRMNGLLYLDLDQFKVVNDAEGHDVGDRMLVEVANKLRSYVKPGQLVARIGSDEFAILLEHVTEEDTIDFAELLRKSLSEFQFNSGSAIYHVGASIGIVLNTPEEDVTVSQLLARADQACYVAKMQGRNTIYKFSREDAGLRELRSDARWVPIIRKALADDNFFLVFQPVLNLHTGKMNHYEALIRMQGDDGEVYTPVDFIPVAERMGLIQQIDLWVVEHALDFLAALPPDKADVCLGINLSGHAFQDRTLLPLIKQKLEMTWISASRLTFEITETAAITNFSETRDMVARLRALGCRFALDDFGSGFCSFSYIKNYPVDMLKIDGSFIVNLMNDETDQLLVKSMIEVSHSLGKKVIAEYVENRQVLEMLREFGVDCVQGNYIGLPDIELLRDVEHTKASRHDEQNDPASNIHLFNPESYINKR